MTPTDLSLTKDKTMARHSKKARAATVATATVAAVALSSGLAYAYWTTTGTGTGTAAATTANGLTTTAAVAAGTLYPGGSSTGTVAIKNSNPFPVKVTSAVFSTSISVDAAHSSSCTVSGVSFVATTPPTAQTPLIVPAKANGTDGAQNLAYTAAMSNASDNGCQGATFSSNVALAGQS